jgi:OOP family OmpA-OmpF porin
MQRIKLSSATQVVALVACLGAVSAQAEGLYLGGSLGGSHYTGSVNGISGDNGGLAGKVFGGYQLNQNFAVEGGVATLGRLSGDAGHVNGHSEYLDAVGLLPLNPSWSLLGSVGVAHVNLNSSNGDDSGAALKLGLGAEYAYSKNVALRGEYENYRVDSFGAHPNVGQYNFGVRVSF